MRIGPRFIYDSMCRDVKQSNLTFWKSIIENDDKIDEYKPIFLKVRRIANREKNKAVSQFISNILGPR